MTANDNNTASDLNSNPDSDSDGLLAESAAPTQQSNHSEHTDQPLPVMRLDDFLKRCGMAGTGGQAKYWIQAGDVRLNGEVETRRRKQLALGDVIECLGETFTLGPEHFY
ncbi:RNA-binding S4 domain-containing protein [Stieleria varia]|uniref:Ribosome-associated protein n=1 Tax=Stieleria varia TaxID=2528005 RepID=A0A5C6A3J8_9BACT|nr:RNA-binding S4 domain-containing protein [Stieleria varia]TWT93917.1 ribosome-associated protein [Stieleria varia]